MSSDITDISDTASSITALHYIVHTLGHIL